MRISQLSLICSIACGFNLIPIVLPIDSLSQSLLLPAIAQTKADQKAEADRLLQQGIQLFQTSQFREALQSWERALTIYREIDDRRGEGKALGSLGSAYYALGQYQQAIDFHQQRLAIFKEIGDRQGEGKALGNLGNAYFSLSQYQQAIDFHQQRLAIAKKLGDRQGEGIALGNLGNAYFSLGQYQQAIDFHQQSLAIAKEIGDRQGEANALGNLGLAYLSLGQYQQAIDFHQQRLTIAQEIGDRLGEGNALGSLGNAYFSLGQYQQAIDFYQQSLEIAREIGGRQGEANSLSGLGIAYYALGQYQQAIDFHQQSLAIAKEIGDRLGEGQSLGNLGIAYDALGQYQQAIDFHQQRLAIAKEIGDRLGEGQSLGNLGSAYSALGQYQQAIEHYQQALAIQQEIGDREGLGLWLSNIGILLEKQNQPELAIVFLKQSVNQREEIRADNRGLSQELQQSYTDTVSGSYRRLADLLLQQDRVLEAQRVLDLLKVQELDDYLRGVRRNAQTESGVVLRPQEQAALELFQQYQDQLIALGKELTQLSQIPVEQRTQQQIDRVTELRELEMATREQFNQFYDSKEIQAIVAQLRNTTGAANLEMSELNDLRDNLQKLQQNAVVLYPLILDDRLELVLVTADSPPIRRTVNVSKTDLNQAIADFRSALNNPSSDAITPAQTLYNWLIRPIEADLAQAQADTLIYAPDGQLRYIPLAALHDGQQWLVQKLAVNNITSASLDDLDNAPAPTSLTLLAAAFTEGQHQVQTGDRSFSFAGLEFAGREVENLSALLPQTVKRLNNDFTSSIVTEMDDYRIVHLATHAAFNPGPPENSLILFGDGSWATLTDVKNWSFPNVDLIVLSACQTAEGDVPLGNGEEILGFGYLMQLAGADAAIASLWSVNDGGTQVLMDAFYAALSNGHTKAEALRRAQIALITSDDSVLKGERGNATIELISSRTGQPIALDRLNHPYFWAPFILIGNGL